MQIENRKAAIRKMDMLLNHLQTTKAYAVELGLPFSETDSPVAPAMELTLEMIEALELVLKDVRAQM